MLVYSFVFLIVLLSNLFSQNKFNKISFYFTVFVLVIFAGTRSSGVDMDYEEYSRLFKESYNWGIMANRELSFYIIPKLSSFFTTYYVESSFLLIAFFSVFFKVKFIYLYSSNIFLSILIYLSLFYLNNEFTVIRSGLFGAIFLFAIKDLNDNNFRGYWIKFLLGFLVHHLAIILIPLFFVLRSNIEIKKILYILIISVLLYIARIDIFSYIDISKIFSRAVDYQNSSDTSLNIFNFKIIFSFLVIGVVLTVYNKLNNLNQSYFKCYVLGLAAFFLFANSSNIVFSLRIYDLLTIGQIVFIPQILSVCNVKFRTPVYLFIISIALVTLYYALYISGNIMSYKSWLF